MYERFVNSNSHTTTAATPHNYDCHSIWEFVLWSKVFLIAIYWSKDEAEGNPKVFRTVNSVTSNKAKRITYKDICKTINKTSFSDLTENFGTLSFII